MTTRLTSERLRELLHYEPKTGVFTWREQRGFGNRVDAGTVAGTPSDGRVLIMVDGRLYKAHRLAYLYMEGRWPHGLIDHRNTNPSDNSWDNLRAVSQTVNMQNRRRAQSNSRTGLLGVSPVGKKFRARIRVDEKDVYLGRFDTPEQAYAAYLEAKRRLHPGNTL